MENIGKVWYARIIGVYFMVSLLPILSGDFPLKWQIISLKTY